MAPTPRDQILTRMYVVLTLLCLAPLLVAGQVARIYFAEGRELREQGVQQASSYVDIPAMRGAILDRNGRALAVNTARFDVAVDPTVDGFAQQQSSFFEKLSKLTGHPASSLAERVRRRSSPQYVVLVRGLSEAQKEVLDTWDVPGLILHPRYARRYNYGTTAAHLLGYVGAEARGLAGLELQYNEPLRGQPGRRAVRRDRRGVQKAVVGGAMVEPRHGESLVLTVDLIRQTILEAELARGLAESGARWGAAIAMDPNSGAILALANVPTFDPNRPAAFDAGHRRNRAITDRLEPGSTFKLVTAVAALEEKVMALGDSIDTGDGWMTIHGHTVRDDHALGRISFEEAIVHSSNVAMARVAQQMEAGTFYQYARNLGFGQPTWIDLPGEVSGRLKKPDAWSGTTLTSMSRGYEVDATPLQVLAAYSALANGGLLVQPYVVAERRDVTGRVVWRARQDSIRRAFDRATAAKLKPAFERVVNEGTARLARVEGMAIAGKTGTALKAAGGGYDAGHYRASFVGFFPADDPQVALLVVLDEPRSSIYGGSVAAPIFQRIARRWVATFPLLAARLAPEGELPEEAPQPVPALEGQPVRVALARLQAAGLRGVVDDAHPEQPVAAQRPAPGTAADPGDRVRLVPAAAPPPSVMPDLRGLSSRQAVYWLAVRGVKVRLQGSGVVAAQAPQPGAALPEQAVLTLK